MGCYPRTRTDSPHSLSLKLVPLALNRMWPVVVTVVRSASAARSSLARCLSTTQFVPRKLDLTGIYPPVTTPFNEDESLAWDRLAENIAKYDEAPLRGYLVQGSNGEYCFMSREERVEMVKKVATPFKLPQKSRAKLNTNISFRFGQRPRKRS